MVVVAEYIWLDAKKHLRSKTKVIYSDLLLPNLPGYGKVKVKNQLKSWLNTFQIGIMMVVQRDRLWDYIVN